MASSEDEIRESSDGAKSWIDEVLRDGVPKTDKVKLMPTHPRDPPRFSCVTIRFSCQRRALNLWKSDLESTHKPKYQILSIRSRGQK